MGKSAEEMASYFSKKVVTAHPSPLSAYRGFFGSKPYSNANAALVSAGLSPVDWSC